MRINSERHFHGAVSGKILDFLQIQTGLKQAGYVRVPQNVRGDMPLRKRVVDLCEQLAKSC